MKWFSVLKKDLVILLRSPVELLVLFLMPLAFILPISFALGGGDGYGINRDNQMILLPVVNYDQGPRAQDLLAAIGESLRLETNYGPELIEALDLARDPDCAPVITAVEAAAAEDTVQTQTSPACNEKIARTLLARSMRPAALIIRPGFSPAVDAGEQTAVELLYDPAGDSTRYQQVEAVVKGATIKLSLQNQVSSGLDQLDALAILAPEAVRSSLAAQIAPEEAEGTEEDLLPEATEEPEAETSPFEETASPFEETASPFGETASPFGETSTPFEATAEPVVPPPPAGDETAPFAEEAAEEELLPVLSLVKVTPEAVNQAGTPNTYQQTVPGYAVMFVFFIITSLVGSIRQERLHGTFRRLLSAPVGRADLLGGKLLATMVVGVAQVLVLFLVCALIFRLGLGNDPLAFLALTIALVAAAACLGLAASTTRLRGAGLAAPLIIAALLGGCMFPLDLMPPALRSISYAVPHSWALRGFQDLMVRGQGLQEIMPHIAALLGFALLFFLIAIWRFDFTEQETGR